MECDPISRPDWSKAYYCVTIDMATRGNFILGAGITKREAKEKAISNLMHLFPLNRASIIYEHSECIRNLDIYYGMMPRANVRGQTYNRLNMRYCEAKIYIYGQERGYNGMSYVLSRKIANFAEYCCYYKSYHNGIHLQMQFV